MFQGLINIWKYFIKLKAEKQIIGVVGGALLFIGFLFFKERNSNLSSSNEYKKHIQKMNDTCQLEKKELQRQVSYWKDSVASEKLLNAIKEINEMKKIADDVKLIENRVSKKTQEIKQKQSNLLKKINK
jgi:gas vesicle protein